MTHAEGQAQLTFDGSFQPPSSMPLWKEESLSTAVPSDNKVPFGCYEHPHGRLYCGDSVAWLVTLQDGIADLVFADPPYNVNKAEWDDFESQEAYIAWSVEWIEQAARVLKPTGSLYICGYSEILADVKHPASRFF